MKEKFDSISITGFILSIISIIFFPLCLFGLGFSIWGFIRTKDTRTKKGNSFAIVGIIISSIMIVTSIFIIGMFLVLFSLISNNLNFNESILDYSENSSSVSEGTQIANPASEFCIERGNDLEIRTDSNGGQEGICISEDKKECEEWAYYRGECEF